MDLEELDSNLKSAVEKSAETGTTTPLLKQVLRLYIQSSRLAKGQEELPKSEFKEPEQYPLTKEEEQRRDRRRERNRVAARKCRQKKKSAIEQAEDNFTEELRRKNQLLNQIRVLEKEKKCLEEKLGLSVVVEIETTEAPPTKRKRTDNKRTELLASSPSAASVTPDRPLLPPVCTTPQKQVIPSHSPLPGPSQPPPPPYRPTLQSPSFNIQDQCPQDHHNQLNQGSYPGVSISPTSLSPQDVFSPLEISTSRDFDPVLTSPGFCQRPSYAATASYTEMLSESPTQHSPNSVHVFTEPPPYQPVAHDILPGSTLTSTYQPIDLLALSPTAGEFCQEATSTFPVLEHHVMSPPVTSGLHVLTESQLPETPAPRHSPYHPGSLVDLLTMSPSAEYFRPQSPPESSSTWTEMSPVIPTLPSESPTLWTSPFDSQTLPLQNLDSTEPKPTSFIDPHPSNIPSTVYETLEKDGEGGSLTTKNRNFCHQDEAEVPGLLTSDDELASSQESELLYTMYS